MDDVGEELGNLEGNHRAWRGPPTARAMFIAPVKEKSAANVQSKRERNQKKKEKFARQAQEADDEDEDGNDEEEDEEYEEEYEEEEEEVTIVSKGDG